MGSKAPDPKPRPFCRFCNLDGWRFLFASWASSSTGCRNCGGTGYEPEVLPTSALTPAPPPKKVGPHCGKPI